MQRQNVAESKLTGVQRLTQTAAVSEGNICPHNSSQCICIKISQRGIAVSDKAGTVNLNRQRDLAFAHSLAGDTNIFVIDGLD